jgi:hypothetical protein
VNDKDNSTTNQDIVEARLKFFETNGWVCLQDSLSCCCGPRFVHVEMNGSILLSGFEERNSEKGTIYWLKDFLKMYVFKQKPLRGRSLPQTQQLAVVHVDGVM